MSGASRIANYRARHRDADVMATLAEFVTVIKQNQAIIERLIQRHETLVEEVQLLARQVDRLLGEGSVTLIKRNQEVTKEARQSEPRARVEVDSPSKSPMELRKKHTSSASTSPEFEAFWAIWPHKVDKIKAFESHTKALTRVSQAELLEGVRRYVASKPDSQQWCYPATWLNRDRWTDRPAPPVRERSNGGSNYSGLFG